MFQVHYYNFAKKYSFTDALNVTLVSAILKSLIFGSKYATKESLATSSNGLTCDLLCVTMKFIKFRIF